MNYHAAIRGLIAEARQSIRFKGLSKGKRIALTIALIPLIVSAFFSVVSYYAVLFLYKGLTAPVDFLHKIVKDEAKDVKHATQFAIYWLTFPIVFFFYLLQSLAAIFFYFQWFGLMVAMYLVTLGGVRFQPFLSEVEYNGEKVNWKLTPGEKGTFTFAIITLAAYACVIVGALAAFGAEIEEALILCGLGGATAGVMLVIVNPLLFKKTVASDEPTPEPVRPVVKPAEPVTRPVVRPVDPVARPARPVVKPAEPVEPLEVDDLSDDLSDD